MEDSTKRVILFWIIYGIFLCISYFINIILMIFLIILGLSILMAFVESADKQKKSAKHIYVDEEFEHLGGYPYLKQNDIIKIQIHNDNLEIVTRYNNDRVIGKPIPISNVKDIQFKSEEEIQKDVTLTRLLTLGVFAFALPKQTTKNNQYLYLEYEQDNVNIKCLFKATANTKAGNLLSVFNKKKLESIQQQ